jgi:hypothetical protein
MWADNAASNPYFGNAYVCYAAFQGNGAQPLTVLTSQGGGSSCALHQVTPFMRRVLSFRGIFSGGGPEDREGEPSWHVG